MADTDDTVQTAFGDPVVEEARKRFDRCAEWESSFRSKFLDDIRFANGDSDNGYQWPNSIRRSRDVDQRPCLTMNIVRQHNLQIVNEASKNKSDVKVIGLGNGATQESANVMKSLIRHIGYQSNAQAARKTAREFQVAGGYGVWRIITDYAGADTFDQEIFIRRVWDPLSVYLDPDCQERDCSDGKYAFVFDELPRDEFEEAYPKLKDLVGNAPLGSSTAGDSSSWITESHVRVCEYFRKVEKEDTLVSFMADGERQVIRKSKLAANMREEILDDPLTKTRTIAVEAVEWYLIAGERIIDQTEWPGKYIPLIRIIGEEVVIGGILDRKGHTRAMKDAQRMYNFNASSQVEFVALQGKTPWVAPAKAIEEFESYWNTANTVNHSVLPWNHVDDDNPTVMIPSPTRQEPPNSAPAYENGMSTAFNQMMMTSGQWQNEMGMMGNERTGRAIAERQEQSATSVFHFQDNYAEGLRYEGKQLIDLIPKVYDTRRVKRVLADDGVELEIELDPAARLAYFQHTNHQDEVIKRVFNPQLGEYDIAADVGPALGSRRQETVEALTLILTQAPALTGIIGDLLLKAMDFEEAQEAAQRLKRMVPPLALGKGPSQSEQQLQQQVQSLSMALSKALQAHAKDRLKLTGKDQMRDIDVYKAETDRFKAMSDVLMLDQGGIEQIVEQLVNDSMNTKITPILEANQQGVAEQSGNPSATAGASPGAANGNGTAGAGNPPVPGAQQAPDGEWYLTDPTRQGRYLRVVPLAQEHRPRGIIANA